MKNIPVIMIIFGGSGDLAHRKLYPALFNLYEQGLIHDNFAVIGTARRPWSHEYLREQVSDAVHETHNEVNENDLKEFASHFYYQSHDVTNVEHYVTLKELAQDLDDRYCAHGNRLFYMAMAPRFFGTIATHINDQHLTGSGFNRIVVEKPFGRDLASAEELNKQITASFDESEIFRIDHYLGKEMIQNILPMRFTNPLIKNIWNSDNIKNIQVTLAERLGVEARGGYYETSGALRDMVQNHIFQIITLLAMPEPENISAEAIHKAKGKLLASLVMPTEADIKQHFVRGQYAGSDTTFAYRQEPNVAEDSTTETFAAGEVKFSKGPIAGVPIYFRTGKEFKEKKSRIDIVLKHMNNPYGRAHSNNITIVIDPQSEIYITINGKKIREAGIRRENLDYTFSKEEMAQVPDGYERLLHDVFVNDSTNFTHWSELKRYWEYIDTIEAAWQKENESGQAEIPQYPPYRMGPKEACDIFESATEHWIYE
ncbi:MULTISPECIES: glucose-6-phosphate dehydrogenase [Lactobacillus]|uniref:Glucose-6-phosphate 1-dehydrogenase n=1 Tax=Lactobacillus xujianguonis TaxID=2495899 RepID=A0A437SUC3_9LACO|nr:MULTISPECIES: glucose-6-phosphate dehydrogenase [Lactobacillus]RVU70541.1 glucose-6-phosphate dehydrogenase [Lactobacillus xujianguonis]RVU77038.1 glucose-6-phosphate dehydrogenase [Lactobacillus xujianguonis]